MMASAITLSVPIDSLSKMPPKIFREFILFSRDYSVRWRKKAGLLRAYHRRLAFHFGISPERRGFQSFLTKVFLVTKYFDPACLRPLLNSLTQFYISQVVKIGKHQ